QGGTHRARKPHERFSVDERQGGVAVGGDERVVVLGQDDVVDVGRDDIAAGSGAAERGDGVDGAVEGDGVCVDPAERNAVHDVGACGDVEVHSPISVRTSSSKSFSLNGFSRNASAPISNANV